MHLPRVRITERQLQGKFNSNEGGYPAKIDSLRRVCIYDRPASPKSGQVAGSRSLVFKYYDGKLLVMILQYFVEPSGKLGASKKMDPKLLLVDRTYYFK